MMDWTDSWCFSKRAKDLRNAGTACVQDVYAPAERLTNNLAAIATEHPKAESGRDSQG